MLWQKYITAFSDDILFQACLGAENNPAYTFTDSDIHNIALNQLEAILIRNGFCLANFPDMPVPIPLSEDHVHQNYLLAKELQYDLDLLKVRAQEAYSCLNPEQLSIFDAVIMAVENQQPAAFFVDGPGGSGKTFLYGAILDKIRSSGHIALAVATSGIAALLLDGGCTAHSLFRIPFELHEDSICNISHGTDHALLLQQASLIVWDEAPMAHRFAPEAVDRTLRDLMKAIDPNLQNQPFGGKVIVFGGDFHQILPVVPKGRREDIISSCLLCSPLWHHVKVMKLTVNMRLLQTESAEETIECQNFAKWLLEIGEDRAEHIVERGNCIKLPDNIWLTSQSIHELIDFVYPNISIHAGDSSYLMQRGILAPKNADVQLINSTMMNIYPGEEVEYLSADGIDETQGNNQENIYPTEFLNSLNVSGLPPHKLSLKIGAPIILLRNINPSEGLCNGTRLVCCSFAQHVIEVQVITGKHAGLRTFLPRITLTPSNMTFPFVLRRRQFPVQPAFAMTINKAQGQTLNNVGIYLPTPVFSHGQLYVACSRTTAKQNLKILAIGQHADAGYTQNIVYPEVLQS